MRTFVVVKSFVDGDGRQGHRIYAGKGPDQLEVSGTLFMPPDQWRVFSDGLLAGAKHSGGNLVVILEGDERSKPRDED